MGGWEETGRGEAEDFEGAPKGGCVSHARRHSRRKAAANSPARHIPRRGSPIPPILRATAPPEFLEIKKDNLTSGITRRQARREEVLQYGCGSVVFAGVDFDAGESGGRDGWGGETETGPGELVVDADGGEEVVGWLGGVAVVELWRLC